MRATRILVAAVLVTAAACAKKHTVRAVEPPGGHDLLPVVVTTSTFWQTLDDEACPIIAKSADAPAGYEPWWPGLRAYCGATPRSPGVVELAGRIDREAVLAGIVKELTTSRAAPCKAAGDGLKGAADLQKLVDEVCKANEVTPAQLDALNNRAAALTRLSEALGRADTVATFSSTCADTLRTLGAPGGPETELVDRAKALCEGNPTLKDVQKLRDQARALSANAATLSSFAAAAAQWSSASRGVIAGAAGAAGVLSPVSLTSIADVALQGLAQFLVKRAELELRTYAIDKLRAIAQCEDPPESSVVHRLLATTCEFLGGETGTLQAGFGPGLRSAFAQDLTSLPRNVAREVPARGGTPELLVRIALESSATIADDPDAMQVVARILVLAHRSDLDAGHQPKPEDEAFFCTSDAPTTTAGAKEIKDCHDTKALLYVAAVMAREVLTDGSRIQLTGPQLLDRLAQRITEIEAAIPEESALHAAFAQLAALNLGSSDWKRLLAQLHDDADRLIANLKAARAVIAALPDNPTLEQRAKAVVTSTKHALRGLDRATAIAACVQQVALQKAPVDCPTERTYLPGQIADFLDALGRRDMTALMAASMTMARGALRKTKFAKILTPEVTRLLSFGAELANAKDAKEAEAAIEAIAMPPGGYKEKRKRDFLSITGLVGVGGGYEWVASEQSHGWTTAITGTVGIDVNHHFESCKWTIGAYLTVIDLGGILNFGADSDAVDGMTTKTVDDAPKVGFAQVFAPGVGFRLGIHDSPAVLMAGFQVVPHARVVSSDGGTPMDPADDTTRERAVVRAMLTIGVDVTIWAF